MTAYRCYLLDSQNKIRAVETFECACDADAVVQATTLFDSRDGFDAIEIWCDARIVGRIPRHSQAPHKQNVA